MIDLSKSQKKVARELITLGLQRECKSFTAQVKEFTNSQEWETEDPHQFYLKLYKDVITFDKHIGKRYDNLGGSRYFMTVFGLFYDGILTTDDIAGFSTEVQNELLRIKQLYDNDLEG